MDAVHEPLHEVLVVEDDTDLREALVMIVESDGYRVRSAPDGREALSLLRTGPVPSVVIVDLFMPVMDGWELCEEIAADPRLANLPVLLMTASGGPLPPPRPQRFLRLFRKPFTYPQLLEAIGAACGRPSVRPAR